MYIAAFGISREPNELENSWKRGNFGKMWQEKKKEEAKMLTRSICRLRNFKCFKNCKNGDNWEIIKKSI